MTQPNRGEVWSVDLGLAAKVRPCLVLSIPFEEEDRALVTIIPHTTSIRNSRFECRIATTFLKLGAFDAQNLLTIPKAKFLRKLGSLSQQQLATVEDSVRLWLGL